MICLGDVARPQPHLYHVFLYLMNTFVSLFLFETIIMTIGTLILAWIRYIVVETIVAGKLIEMLDLPIEWL